MNRGQFTAAIVGLATALLALGSASSAPAAFPGRNGLIAFRSDTSEASTQQLFSIAPNGAGRRNLTHNLYPNVNGSWSPDGRRIAFVQQNSPGSALVVMNADGSGQRPLTDRKAWASEPAWSPDGSLVAYLQAYAPAGVHVIRPDGTGDRLVAPDVSTQWPLSWSPDGRQLVVVRELASGGNALTILDLDGGAMRDLRSGGSYGNPAWAPDGSAIAFAQTASDYWTLRIVRPDGTGERNLDRGWRGVWSPDGRRLAVVADVNAPNALWVLEGARRVTLSLKAYDYPTWSPDGQRLAFVDEDAREVVLVSAAGGRRTRVTDEPGHTMVERPAWSPDGRRILYQAVRGQNDDELYVLDATGRTRALTRTDGADEVDPAWSPDGSRLAFVRAKPGSDEDFGGLFVMQAGGTVQRLTRGPADGYPSWSPDGSRLAFTRGFSGDDSDSIVVMRDDGSHVRKLGRGYEPAWSPDGRTIAFSHDGDLWLMRSDGTHRKLLVDAGDTGPALGLTWEYIDSHSAPAWSPDGRQLAFVVYYAYGRQMDYMAVLTVEVVTGKIAVRVIDLPPDKVTVDWSPDGKSFVVGAGQVLVGPVGTEPVDRTPALPGENTDVTWQPLCTAYGSARSNGMQGSLGNDVLCGLGGSDRIYGGGGSDRLFGGDGNDLIRAADGVFDVVGCGSGHDEVTADRVDLVGVDCESVRRV